jgi:plastocyanin
MGLIAARPAPADRVVAIHGFGFKPDTLVIAAGTSVVWTNQDEIEHTVTAVADSGTSPVFNGVLAGVGKTLRLTFDHAGSFSYACARHSFMRGVIRVTSQGDR